MPEQEEKNKAAQGSDLWICNDSQMTNKRKSEALQVLTYQLSLLQRLHLAASLIGPFREPSRSLALTKVRMN
jgi:hypothetical protein